MHDLKTGHSFLFICFFALTLISCTSEASLQDEATYDQLCQIYDEVNALDKETEEKRVEIIDRVDTQLPALFEKHFKHIIDADAGQRYALIQQVVAHETGNSDWECQAMETYYTNY